MSTRSLLLLIPQSPFDPASGAAISVRTICEMLARAGWRVEAVAPAASESAVPGGTGRVLESMGSKVGFQKPPVPSGRPVFSFSRRLVNYRLLDTGTESVSKSRELFVEDLDALTSMTLEASGVPDIVLTYGSSEAEVRRRRTLQELGAAVVFSAHNTGYLHPRAFEATDAILAYSRFIVQHYRSTHGVEPAQLPLPVSVEDVVASRSCPMFFTFVNPELTKGLTFFLRLVQECSVRWPEMQFLVVEGRGSGQLVARVAELLGLDIRAMENLHFAVNTFSASSIWAVTRFLLVPSLFEAAGRVAVEAQLNGIPVIASNRGGLPETVGAGGFLLPVVADVNTLEAKAVITLWLNLIGRLHTDSVFYEQARRSAVDAAHPHASGEVERRHLARFSAIAQQGSDRIRRPSLRVP